MNDLEKLEYACELAKEYYKKEGCTVIIETNSSFGCSKYPHKLWINSTDYKFNTIEEIINELEKLIELTHETHSKPTIGLFGNEIQNQEMQRILEGIYLRLTALEMKGLNK